MEYTKERFYASLLVMGSAILLYLAIQMVADGSLMRLQWWVSMLLIMEMALDLGWMLVAMFWFRNGDPMKDRLPLRLATAAILLHAIRVLIFVLGRTGPRTNFDIRPEYLAIHPETPGRAMIWFASIMSALGVLGVIIIWRIRVHRRSNRY
jgi:hypothetical protein